MFKNKQYVLFTFTQKLKLQKKNNKTLFKELHYLKRYLVYL